MFATRLLLKPAWALHLLSEMLGLSCLACSESQEFSCVKRIKINFRKKACLQTRATRHTFVYRLAGRLPLALAKAVRMLAQKQQLGDLRELVIVDAAVPVGGVHESADPRGPVPDMALVLLPMGISLALAPTTGTPCISGVARFHNLAVEIQRRSASDYAKDAKPGVQMGQSRLLL